MAKQVQLRGGTTSQHSSFTGVAREVTVDTDKDTIVVHDGSTAGGVPLAKASELPTLTSLSVTATAAELNILDGVTSTAAELNILDGVTSTAAELNYTDGVTSAIQTQLDTKLSSVADNSVTLAKMAGGTDGNLITYDASGDPAYVTTGTSGQVLTSGGTGVAPTFQAAAGGGLASIQTFTSSGTYTRPAGVTKAMVYVVGGGGGGTGSGYRGSGGSGGCAIKFIASVGSTETVTIGAGGAGASSGSAATGSTSSFGSHCSATGGGGGVSNKGGLGGVGSSGDVNLNGSGGDSNNEGSSGGSSIFGGGGAGFGSGTVNGDGFQGGGGGVEGGTGGDGGAGIIVVYEY